MQHPRQSPARRHWTKRLVLCLLLGAVLQYAGAIAIGIHAPNSPRPVPGSWVLLAHDTGISLRLEVALSESAGRDKVTGRFSYLTTLPLDVAAKRIQDISPGEWSRVSSVQSVAGEPRHEPTLDRPPSWSRLANMQEQPIFLDPRKEPVLWLTYTETASGWPWRSAGYVAGEHVSDVPGRVSDVVGRGVVVSNPFQAGQSTSRVIPLRIIWPGALANSAVYAAPLLLIWFLLAAARALLRRRRGHCPSCNYNLHANTTGICPECGAMRTP